MSHRVTTQTEIKDKALAIAALKEAGMSFTESGSILSITGGKLRGCTVNLTTGEVEGDSDNGVRGGDDSIGFLKRFYTEAKFKAECGIQGITIESRTVNKAGEIVFTCQGHFG